MLQSMTGFARASVSAGPVAVTVELRSVNSRYLEIHLKLPDDQRPLEPALRQQLSKTFARGKVELSLRYADQTAESRRINQQALHRMLADLAVIRSELPAPGATDPVSLLFAPGILEVKQSDGDTVANLALQAAAEAIEELAAQRAQEGAKLAHVVCERAKAMQSVLTTLREKLPELRKIQRQRILDRIADAGVTPDSKRLEEELIYSAQRADVDEEMDRVDAHLTAIVTALEAGTPCGRRLDFLMQELNREANTLASKSTALMTTNIAVEFKLLIEQMREQIQNLE